MKPGEFNSTPEFQHSREVMRGVLQVPKKRLDELVQRGERQLPAKGESKRAGIEADQKAQTNESVISK